MAAWEEAAPSAPSVPPLDAACDYIEPAVLFGAAQADVPAPDAVEAPSATWWDSTGESVPPADPAGQMPAEVMPPVLPEPVAAEAPEALPPLEPIELEAPTSAIWDCPPSPSLPAEPLPPAWHDLDDPEPPQPLHWEPADPLAPEEPSSALHARPVEIEAPVSLPGPRWEPMAWSVPAVPPAPEAPSWTFEAEPLGPQQAPLTPRPLDPAPWLDLPVVPCDEVPDPAGPVAWTLPPRADACSAQLVAEIAGALAEIGSLAASIGMADLASTLDELGRTHLPSSRSDASTRVGPPVSYMARHDSRPREHPS